jgi:hypothetical protein
MQTPLQITIPTRRLPKLLLKALAEVARIAKAHLVGNFGYALIRLKMVAKPHQLSEGKA